MEILIESIASEKYVWLQERSVMYKNKCYYWLHLFRDYNVRVHINWYRHDASHLAISSAIKQLGGISTIYQRSLEDLPLVLLSTASDIVFRFSNDSNNEKEIGSIIPYHVAVGYIGDYRFKLLKKPSKSLRDKMVKHGAKYIISYFDENSSDDPRWIPGGHKMVRSNYEFLLEKVLSNSWLGLILKPKKPSDLRSRLGSTVEMLDIALKTGRCVIFEGGTLKNPHPPAIAALASDIAISRYTYGGTAGFESALSGTPTLSLNQEGWPYSKLHELGEDRVVFNNWNDLWYACKNYFDHNCKINGFGDWSPILNELDPFRDGKAAERIGTYLNWLLNGFKEERSRESILADAAQRYTETWGVDKISAVNC